MATGAVQAALVGVFALTCAGLVLAWQRGRLLVAALALFVVAAIVWVGEIAAVVTQYRGADEFATCSSDCSTVQYASAMAFLLPPLLIALSAVAMLVSVGRRMRDRREHARGAAP